MTAGQWQTTEPLNRDRPGSGLVRRATWPAGRHTIDEIDLRTLDIAPARGLWP